MPYFPTVTNKIFSGLVTITGYGAIRDENGEILDLSLSNWQYRNFEKIMRIITLHAPSRDVFSPQYTFDKKVVRPPSFTKTPRKLDGTSLFRGKEGDGVVLTHRGTAAAFSYTNCAAVVVKYLDQKDSLSVVAAVVRKNRENSETVVETILGDIPRRHRKETEVWIGIAPRVEIYELVRKQFSTHGVWIGNIKGDNANTIEDKKMEN